MTFKLHFIYSEYYIRVTFVNLKNNHHFKKYLDNIQRLNDTPFSETDCLYVVRLLTSKENHHVPVALSPCRPVAGSVTVQSVDICISGND